MDSFLKKKEEMYQKILHPLRQSWLILAHLSRSDKVSFCDRYSFVVHPSVVRPSSVNN